MEDRAKVQITEPYKQDDKQNGPANYKQSSVTKPKPEQCKQDSVTKQKQEQCKQGSVTKQKPEQCKQDSVTKQKPEQCKQGSVTKQKPEQCKQDSATKLRVRRKKGATFLQLRPSEIRYSHSTIPNKFRNGKHIGDLLDDIVTGIRSAKAINTIDVAKIGDTWYSNNNRWLWVFKQLEHLKQISVITVKVVEQVDAEKFSTRNDGRRVGIVKGRPRGIMTDYIETNIFDYPTTSQQCHYYVLPKRAKTFESDAHGDADDCKIVVKQTSKPKGKPEPYHKYDDDDEGTGTLEYTNKSKPTHTYDDEDGGTSVVEHTNKPRHTGAKFPHLRPSEIGYSQATISNKFRNGKHIGDLLDKIVSGTCSMAEIKPIRVARIDGTWYSSDNRRLWVFKQLEHFKKVSVIRVEVVKQIAAEKFNTTNYGRRVGITKGRHRSIMTDFDNATSEDSHYYVQNKLAKWQSKTVVHRNNPQCKPKPKHKYDSLGSLCREAREDYADPTYEDYLDFNEVPSRSSTRRRVRGVEGQLNEPVLSLVADRMKRPHTPDISPFHIHEEVSRAYASDRLGGEEVNIELTDRDVPEDWFEDVLCQEGVDGCRHTAVGILSEKH